MAPERSEQDAPESVSEPALEDSPPPTASSKAELVPSAAEIFSVDDRLIVLERHDRDHRLLLLQFQDTLVDQIIAVGVLELVFAILLAMNVWSQYKRMVEA